MKSASSINVSSVEYTEIAQKEKQSFDFYIFLPKFRFVLELISITVLPCLKSLQAAFSEGRVSL